LQHASQFQEKCKKIYHKNHAKSKTTSDAATLDQIAKANEIFIIDAHEQMSLHGDEKVVEECGEFEVFEISQSANVSTKSDDYILEMEDESEEPDRPSDMAFRMCGKTRPRRSYTVQASL
jgi:uncharacterized FlgJ-related protein